MARVKVTVREGSKVDRSQHDSVREAIDVLQVRLSNVDAIRGTAKVFKREIAPEDQVVARGEVATRGATGGIDLRGDGSARAWTGRFSKAVVETQRGETAYDALRRVLAQSA